jgi:DNA transformation protein and related proteins
MFGGFGVYAGGLMFGIIHGGRLYLKTGDVREQGGTPFRPRERQTLWTFQLVPADVIDDGPLLRTWATRALSLAVGARRRRG